MDHVQATSDRQTTKKKKVLTDVTNDGIATASDELLQKLTRSIKQIENRE